MRYTFMCKAVIFFELATLLHYANLEMISFRGRCPRPHLRNGWVKLRSRGRIAKFGCAREFTLLGEKFSTCLDGEWDNPPPLCVRPGCEDPSLSNGQVMKTYREAVVTFFCGPGYELQGQAKLYCDGKTWNGTVPQCVATSSEPALSCDFESELLCGWMQDPHHNFNWTRLNHNTPSGYVGTGPSHDHTFGQGKDGYYLYIETSGPRKQNDTARLYSPVFSPDVVAAQPSCFIFWYHMYGATVGTLAVYIKPDNMELTNDLEAGFYQFGNKGDVWLKGVVSIPPTGVPFQIVIEGMRGPGYVGDIAIDDVHLTNGSECQQSTTDSAFVTHEMSLEVPGNFNSCRLRCAQHLVVHQSTYSATDTTEDIPPQCDCQPSCSLSSSCCEDYAVYCIYAEAATSTITGAVTVKSTRSSRTFPTPPPLPPLEPHPLEGSTVALHSTTTIQTTTAAEEVFRPIPIPPDPTPLILNVPHRPAFKTTRVIPTAVDISEILTSTTTSTPTTKVAATVPSTSSTVTVSASSGTTKATTAVNTTTITTRVFNISSTKARAASTSSTLRTTRTSSTPSTLRTTRTSSTASTLRTTRTSSTLSTLRSTRTSSTPSTLRSSRTSSTPSTSLRSTPSTLALNTSTSRPQVTTTTKRRSSRKSKVFVPSTISPYWENEVHGKEWRAAPRRPAMHSEQAVPISLIAGIAVLSAAVVAVAIVASIFIRQRRKSRNQQNLAEDSDVRFLTADEVLDFTLARPQEDERF